MSCRNYCWILILVSLHCATFLHRPSEFEKGLKLHQQAHFSEAAVHFNNYYVKHPDSDTTLYYLYDCYKQLSQPEQSARVLEQLVKIGSKDEKVYLALFSYYHKTARYRDLYRLLINLESPVQDTMDERHILTRRLYAEILCGAQEKPVNTDPLVFVTSEGYIPPFPDGQSYENDPITVGNLIILLDRLVDPVYPKQFFKMKNISNRSFIYLPYMRLVELGIIELDPELIPEENASITMTIRAVANLKRKGFID